MCPAREAFYEEKAWNGNPLSPFYEENLRQKLLDRKSPPPPRLETFRKFAACGPPGLPLELIYPIYLLQDDIFIKVILPS